MKNRIASIDIFRALTMLLMIFVNDLWTLHDIPVWLEHTKADEDGMGLADVVFPAFLFIVGLSIPFAIKARINKGDSRVKVMLHIIRRSLALVIMGFFMVNQDSFRSDIPELYRNIWQVCMILAFLLIWNNYENKKVMGKIPVWLLQALGILGLLLLALFFKGGTPENPQWMSPQWWGILGLIGWAYLLCSAIYLFAQTRFWTILIAWIVLYLLNLLEFLPLAKNFPQPLLIISSSNYALVMSGVLATLIYMQTRNSGKKLLFPALLVIPAIIALAYGFAVRPLWGISKIMATPSWTAICAGISFAFFALIYLVADVLNYSRWACIIMPAGTSALTCYLLPGLVYPLLWPLQQLLPESFLEGWVGLLKSLLFALLIIVLTGLLEKIKIRLKI
jgi:predicted acyltransferase